MPELDDIALLRQYAEGDSESAFSTLAERYVNLVYSTALRSIGNPHAAEEISQAVFIILAKKAGSLTGDGWLPRWLRRPRRSEVEATPRRQNVEPGRRGVAATPLSGWLYQTTRLTAANFLRGEIRRQKREQEACMQSTLNEPEPEVWSRIAPLLDDAMGRLGEKDRNAIVLRYFENKSLGEVGAALGASEDAAKMRVNRALEKLRKFFTKRGVTLSGMAIAGAVSANSVHAAPVGLAISTVAAAKGSAVAASTLALVKGTMKMMTWMKLKFAAGVGMAALLAGGVATVAVSQTGNGDGVTAQGTLVLKKVVAADRFWLLAPPDAVTHYSYVFHLSLRSAPGGVLQTPVRVSTPARALPSERQGITYSSLLQRLARYPDQVRVQSLKEENGKIRLQLEILPVPGAKTTQVIGGIHYPVPPLGIECGNGLARIFRGYFSTGGTNAELVIDAEKMVPLSSWIEVPNGTVEESYSDYIEVGPGSYVPLSVIVKNTAMSASVGDIVYAWKFKLHDGVWLLDESQYRGEKVAWTDQVVVN